MTDEQIRKLEKIRLYHTRYEISAVKDGQSVLVGYTSRKGRNGLFAMLRNNAEAWVKFAGGDNISFRKRASEGADATGWHINFSGRTQREAIISGELPFFPTLILKVAA